METPAGAPDSFLRRLVSFDEAITVPLIIPETRRVLRGAALALAHSGDSLVWAVLFLGAWFLGGPSWKVRVIIAVAGFIMAELATRIVKMSIRRPRPAGTSGAIYRRTDPYSFPSGHAARAVMLCMIFGFFGPPAAFIAILVWSPLMILSRIAIGIHYVLDIAAGMVMGCGLTFAVIALARYVISRLG
jgi:undecaprenyl-diphosphatase